MSSTPTCPGAYAAETPAGVRTITGVATSIAAFLGQATLGPVNTPVECLSVADYVRNFGAPLAGADLAQSVQQFFANGGDACHVVRLADGNTPAQADYLGSEPLRTGFHALDAVDLFNLMVLPGDGIASEPEWQAIRAAAAAYCRSRRAFLVLDAPLAWTRDNLLAAQASDIEDFRAAIGDNAIDCAVYYPRVQIDDGGTPRCVGASGAIAGVYAATDAARGVWRAPAGTSAALAGVTGLEANLTDQQDELLGPLGVNCLRRLPSGCVVWGARTVAGFAGSGDSDWTYVPVRRMALFLEESLRRGTQWAVFEPNDEPLWAQLRMSIGAFMTGLFRQGAFQGATPAQAFFVKCDSQTTTQRDIDAGVVNIVVGFAPLKPAEFVVIAIQQLTGCVNR